MYAIRSYYALHTNTAIGAIPRLLDLGISPEIMTGTPMCLPICVIAMFNSDSSGAPAEYRP